VESDRERRDQLFCAIRPSFADQVQAEGGELNPGEPGNLANGQASFEDFQTSAFATGTLGALRFVVEGMAELPGRKSVILFSEGWNMFERDEHGFSQSGRVASYLGDSLSKPIGRPSSFIQSTHAGWSIPGLRLLTSSPSLVQAGVHPSRVRGHIALLYPNAAASFSTRKPACRHLLKKPADFPSRTTTILPLA
jgi:hypothetical protein